jgi:hypothetical protein
MAPSNRSPRARDPPRGFAPARALIAPSRMRNKPADSQRARPGSAVGAEASVSVRGSGRLHVKSPAPRTDLCSAETGGRKAAAASLGVSDGAPAR